MSATGRSAAAGTGYTRHKDDFFQTEGWVTRAILPHLDLSGRILEPGCGSGAIIRELVGAGVRTKQITGVELDVDRASDAQRTGATIVCSDYLLWYTFDLFTLAIGNPPFKLAMEFARRARTHATTVCFLLRLNFLAGQKRAKWHRANPADVFVLPRRPSFTGDGKTDATEFAWFKWGPRSEGRIHILEVESKERRR